VAKFSIFTTDIFYLIKNELELIKRLNNNKNTTETKIDIP